MGDLDSETGTQENVSIFVYIGNTNQMALEQVAVPVVFHQNGVDCQKAWGSKTGVWNQFCTSPLKQRKVHETRKTCLYWQTQHRREDRGSKTGVWESVLHFSFKAKEGT